MALEVTDFVASMLPDAGTRACSCTTAVAVAFGADADSSASPTILAPGASAATERSGDAISVSISADGSATASATAGVAADGPAQAVGPDASITRHTAPVLPPSPSRITSAVRSFTAELLRDNDGAAAGTDPMRSTPNPLGAALATVRVDVALSAGPDGRCSRAVKCAVAVSMSVGGSATAHILPTVACVALAAQATAVALSFGGDARATAQPAPEETCAAQQPPDATLSTSGSTGSADSMAIAEHGAARSDARSGDVGDSTDTVTGGSPVRGVTAHSGSTGTATGVAIGRVDATSSATSGASGDADVHCGTCSDVGAGQVSADSGDTGLSFARATAGLKATADARSGASGSAEVTAQGAGGQGVGGGQVVGGQVEGHSGQTGDAIAAAVDPATWVQVLTRSGRSGLVTSITTVPGHPGSAKTSVGSSQPGSRDVRTGSSRRRSTVAVLAGGTSVSRSSTTVHVAATGTTRPVGDADTTAPAGGRPSPVATAPRASPTARPLPTSVEQEAAAITKSSGSSDTVGLIGIAGGILVLGVIALLAALTWLRRGRVRR